MSATENTAVAPGLRWAPIEAAPRDGRTILVDDTNDGASPWVAAKWLQSDEWSGWIYDDELMNDSQPLGPKPTRWLDGLDAAADAPLTQVVPPHPAVANAARMSQLQAQLDLALQAAADGRRAGRAEALEMLLRTKAADFGRSFIAEHGAGATGGASLYAWQEESLRTLFLLDGADPGLALIQRMAAQIVEQMVTIDQLRDRLRNGPKDVKTVEEFFAEAKLLDLRASDIVPKLMERPEFAEEAAIARAAMKDPA